MVIGGYVLCNGNFEFVLFGWVWVFGLEFCVEFYVVEVWFVGDIGWDVEVVVGVVCVDQIVFVGGILDEFVDVVLFLCEFQFCVDVDEGVVGCVDCWVVWQFEEYFGVIIYVGCGVECCVVDWQVEYCVV